MLPLKPLSALAPGQGLALFDIDYTLLTVDSDHGWGRFLVAQGVVDGADYERKNNQFFGLYKAGTLKLEDYLAFSLAPLAQHPRPQLDAWHAQFMESFVLPAITPAAREMVARHQRRGDWCAAVTATNEFITRPIAMAFGIHNLIAVQLEERDGRFTGKPRGTPSFREGKVTRTQEWLAESGRSIASFAESWFYSDSHNDLPLLDAVTHPVVVNGDEKLQRLAQERHWESLSTHPA
jgi:HAD superfamily hydrolase (TIGR01490 family)